MIYVKNKENFKNLHDSCIAVYKGKIFSQASGRPPGLEWKWNLYKILK